MSAWWDQTGVEEDSAEGEESDAPLSADCGPGSRAGVVEVHHQRETAPGEVRADVLLVHHGTHTVADAGGAGWAVRRESLS